MFTWTKRKSERNKKTISFGIEREILYNISVRTITTFKNK